MDSGVRKEDSPLVGVHVLVIKGIHKRKLLMVNGEAQAGYLDVSDPSDPTVDTCVRRNQYAYLLPKTQSNRRPSKITTTCLAKDNQHR